MANPEHFEQFPKWENDKEVQQTLGKFERTQSLPLTPQQPTETRDSFTNRLDGYHGGEKP